MKIRVYGERDLPAVVALWKACGLDRPHDDAARDIAKVRESGNSDLFLAEEGETIVGSVMLGHDGHRAWMYRLAVDPARRRQGIGSALVRFAEGWTALRGIAKLQLMIRSESLEVARFYQKLGYQEQPRAVMARQIELADRAKAPQIEVVITMLEMAARPRHHVAAPPAGKLAILRAERMPVRFFRYLYAAVGDPWFWYYRRYMSDAEIAAIVQDPRVEIYVLYVDGAPGGYVEIDRRDPAQAVINHLGLVTEYIGRGLGPYLLGFAIDAAWLGDPPKVAIETCSLDHPSALPLYQKVGFVPVGQRTEFIEDPRLSGHLPSHLEPRLP
jgi:ribosomal protein S18 acetylase RimI-like enzyme